MITRILLIDVEVGISPENRDSQLWTGEGSQLYSRWAHHPLGMMYLAAAARTAFPDVDVRISHTVTSGDPDQKIERIFSEMAEFKPDLIGLRALSIAQADFTQIASRVRQVMNGATLVAGGPYPSASYDEILSAGLADICVIGEGDETFVEILKEMRNSGRLPLNLPGTAIYEDGEVRLNIGRPLIADIDSLPSPAHDLVDFEEYRGISHHSFTSTAETAFIEASRGCPYQCFYCHQTFGKSIRRHSPERVVAEMRSYRDTYGITNFVFVDDLFNVPQRMAKTTLSLIAKELPGIRINFPNGLRGDQMDDELIDLFEAAGTRHLAIAIESAIPRLQESVIGKHLKLDRAQECVEKLSKRFVCGCFFMVGFPSETYEEALETIEFAQQLDHLVAPILNTVRIFKATPFFSMLNIDKEMMAKLVPQETGLHQPRLEGGDVFYGDFFPDDVVPLKGKDIKELRFRWVEKVFFNPERIRNSHRMLEKHMTHPEMMEFYRNQMDDTAFDERKLEGFLSLGANKKQGRFQLSGEALRTIRRSAELAGERIGME